MDTYSSLHGKGFILKIYKLESQLWGKDESIGVDFIKNIISLSLTLDLTPKPDSCIIAVLFEK